MRHFKSAHAILQMYMFIAIDENFITTEYIIECSEHYGQASKLSAIFTIAKFRLKESFSRERMLVGSALH